MHVLSEAEGLPTVRRGSLTCWNVNTHPKGCGHIGYHLNERLREFQDNRRGARSKMQDDLPYPCAPTLLNVILRNHAMRNPYDETSFDRYIIGIPRSCHSLGMTSAKMSFL